MGVHHYYGHCCSTDVAVHDFDTKYSAIIVINCSQPVQASGCTEMCYVPRCIMLTHV